jgi:hypothetical protein
MSGQEEREEYLENDKEIPGQKYCCLSFLSPENVLANKDLYFFTAFLNDYEIQYKIKATEAFIMAESRRVTDALSKSEDILSNLRSRTEAEPITYADISGVVDMFKNVRQNLTRETGNALENHVKENMRDFKETTIQENFETFMFKNRKRLEDEFFAKNNFRTTMRGLKVRGSYDTYAEAAARAKTIQKLDPSFNVFVGQVGFWLPWDPAPSEIQNQEYAEDQLNTLMKNYKENEVKKDEFFEEQKRERLSNAKVRTGNPSVGPTSNPKEVEIPNAIFDGDDLAITRKAQAQAQALSGNLKNEVA